MQVRENAIRFFEGPKDLPLLNSARDVTLIIEACFSGKARAALLYASNLPPRFFDLSSGEAGEILQKLRQYRIRAAVMCPPGEVRFSSRFPELMAEEKSIGQFGIFETRAAAIEWLKTQAAGAESHSGA